MLRVYFGDDDYCSDDSSDDDGEEDVDNDDLDKTDEEDGDEDTFQQAMQYAYSKKTAVQEGQGKFVVYEAMTGVRDSKA